MRRKVFALALDAVPPLLLEAWLAGGAMPNLARLRGRGAYGALRKAQDHPHEASWSAFVQGCLPGKSGEWSRHEYDPRSYSLHDRPSYRLERHPPFYALPGERPALVFDVPHAAVLPGLRGTQVLGWGVEENLFQSASSPAPLFADLVRRHGPHPFFGGAAARVLAEDAEGTLASFRLPSLYDAEAMAALEGEIRQAVARRAAILRELMAPGAWDLALAASAELHLAMHMLWHRGRPHPLSGALPAAPGGDPLARAARAVDDSLGALLALLPGDAHVAVFSVSGMTANYTDVPTGVFLPELLYRLQFGEPALAPGDAAAPPPPPATHYRRHWKDEIWALRTPRGERDLESPDAQAARGDAFDWCPLNWYRPLWPRMRAFALPSFSHGMVRLNLRGREAAGIVAPADYGRVCDEIGAALRGLVNARSGRPVAHTVARTRADAREDGPHLPPADLLVTWDERECADAVDSPLAGRIGPVPWLRTGGHAPDGFALLHGPGIAPGSALPEGATVMDLTATLLEMLGIEPPAHVEGRSLISRSGRRGSPPARRARRPRPPRAATARGGS